MSSECACTSPCLPARLCVRVCVRVCVCVCARARAHACACAGVFVSATAAAASGGSASSNIEPEGRWLDATVADSKAARSVQARVTTRVRPSSSIAKLKPQRPNVQVEPLLEKGARMEEATPISPTPTQEAEARRVEPTPGLTLLTVLSLVSILWVGLLLTGVAWWFLRRLRRRFGPLHFLGAGVLWWFGRCTPPSTLAAFLGVPLFVRLGCLSRACAHCGTGYDAPTGPGWWGSGLYSHAASPALPSPSPAASTSRPRTPTVRSRHGFVCPIARCPRAAAARVNETA